MYCTVGYLSRIMPWLRDASEIVVFTACSLHPIETFLIAVCIHHMFQIKAVSFLFQKLNKYGVEGSELGWFKSYLTGCKQFVSIGSSSSSLLEISLGVPQGSIQVPLLFILYINDLPLSSKFLSLLFADNTTLLFSHDDLTILSEIVNTEFKKVCKFFLINRLVLHPEKTKFMIFSRSPTIQNFVIFCDNNNPDQNLNAYISPISRVTSDDGLPAFKFLGVFFDPNLNFKHHIFNLKKKLSKALYALQTVKNTLSPKSILLIYNSIFHCRLLYAIQIWSCSRLGPIGELFKFQKKL